MRNIIFKVILISLVLNSRFEKSLFAAETKGEIKKVTTEAEDTVIEFKESKFLQIEKLDIPKELSRIADQIRQNTLDVIITSKTHTPVYAQKVEAGYSDSYKKFHGLDIQIVPIPGQEDFYSLSFFYYNWTNRKFDKRLRKKISKYNVLNELRFGVYEVLLGKNFVDDHKDEIEKQNYERIQAVRENEDVLARIERKKKKILKKKLEEEEIQLSPEEEKESTKLKRDELDKKGDIIDSVDEKTNPPSTSKSAAFKDGDSDEDKAINSVDELEELKKDKKTLKSKGKTKKKVKPKPTKEETPPPVPIAPADLPNPDVKEIIPIVSSLYAFVNSFNDSVISDGLLHSTSTLRYLGFGARYINEQETSMPRGMRFSLKVGMPVKKDEYLFPVYRSFEAEIYKRNIFNHFQVFGGVDLAPIYFVNLANPGEGLKVFENDIFWLKGGLAFNQEIFGKEFDFRVIYLKSAIAKSNVNKSLAGTSLAFNVYYQHTKKHGAEFLTKSTSMVGDLSIASKSVYFSYVYKFEN